MMFIFGLLKSELLYLQEFKSMKHFNLELYAYLEYYGSNVPLFRRNGYRQSGAMIP